MVRLNLSDMIPLNSTVMAPPPAPTATPAPAATQTQPQTPEYREQPFIFVCSHQELYLDKKWRPLPEEVILKKINDAFEGSDRPWLKAIQFLRVRRVPPPKEKTFDPPRRLRLDVKTWRDRADLYEKDAHQRDWLRLLEQQQPHGANIEATELRPRPLRAKKSGKRGGRKGELKTQQSSQQKPAQETEQTPEQTPQQRHQQKAEQKAEQRPQQQTQRKPQQKAEPKAEKK